jgi:antitoxin (DNA-binding transcriptional repressor) of toxin-antitoxin stability system
MMALKTIDLDATPLTLEELLDTLDANTGVLLTRGDTPVARVTAVEPKVQPKQRVLGLHEGQGWISDDFTDELPDSFWFGEDE